MKKTVLTFGLIAGAVLSASMLTMISFFDSVGFDRGELIGYTSMVLAFMLIFFGVRSYRDNVAGGTIRFIRAFTVGALIGAVAAVCYVATWEVAYPRIAPDFIERYQAHVIEKARAEGDSEEEISRQKAQLEKYARMYRKPAIRAAITFFEPMPVALIISLVSAGVLSRSKTDNPIAS